MECETRWTVDGHELTVPELASCLKEIIKILKPNLWNKDKVGAWCKYLGKIDYGTK